MHPLQYIAVAVMVFISLPLAAAAALVLFMAAFPNAVKHKHDSRLLRWPLTIKSFWLEFWDFVDILTSGKRARNFMEEIWKSEP